jgi:hypothetical protein
MELFDNQLAPRAAKVASKLIMALALPACGEDVARWTEDVQLHDGRVVAVERRAVRASSGFPTAHRGSVKSWELCYAPKKIYWRSDAEFQPSGFELQGDIAFVKVPLRDCVVCKVAESPRDSTLYFAYMEGKWIRIESPRYPGKEWKNLMVGGLFDGRDARKDVHGHLSVIDKLKRDVVSGGQKYQEVLRADQLQTCGRCTSDVNTNLQLRVEHHPSDSFCR